MFVTVATYNTYSIRGDYRVKAVKLKLTFLLMILSKKALLIKLLWYPMVFYSHWFLLLDVVVRSSVHLVSKNWLKKPECFH